MWRNAIHSSATLLFGWCLVWCWTRRRRAKIPRRQSILPNAIIHEDRRLAIHLGSKNLADPEPKLHHINLEASPCYMSHFRSQGSIEVSANSKLNQSVRENLHHDDNPFWWLSKAASHSNFQSSDSDEGCPPPQALRIHCRPWYYSWGFLFDRNRA